MCGIAGIISSKSFEASSLNKLSKIIRHRGPDDEGFFTIDKNWSLSFYKGDDTIPEFQSQQHIASVNSEINLGFAHRRLSILDLSSFGHQPMVLGDNRYVISYNGEIYNYKEIRSELEAFGLSFHSGSDTEVILNAYAQWGEDCVQKFVGMWTFALYDKTKDEVFISRDRFGVKPLYYFHDGETFVFASEIKAILESGFVNAELDEQNLYQYFAFGKISDHAQTVFKNIVELPAGHQLIYYIKKNTFEIKEYYSLEKVTEGAYNNSRNGISHDYYLEYKNLLESAVNLHMRSDVTVGSCLSGGMDSSAIVAIASKSVSEANFNTFTAAYSDSKIDESYYAKSVINSLRNVTGFFTSPSSSGYQNDIDKLIWHQDLPIASSSMFAQWEVMKLAHNHRIKVLLDGQGADETLGGYSIFAGVYLYGLLKSGRIFNLISESQNLQQNRSINVVNEMGRAISYSLPQAMMLKLREKKRAGQQMLKSDFKNRWKQEEGLEVDGGNFRRLSLHNVKYGLRDLLRYEDRNSMAFSIESRVPFLDHRLVEFTLSLPDSFKIHKGWTKYILRKSVENDLPKEVVWRKDKKGFVTPQKAWKNELKNYLNDYISSANFPQMLDKKFILNFSNGDISDPNQLSEFWKMFSFLKWNEIFKVTA